MTGVDAARDCSASPSRRSRAWTCQGDLQGYRGAEDGLNNSEDSARAHDGGSSVMRCRVTLGSLTDLDESNGGQ